MIKNIALIAHDNKKKDMIEWVNCNRSVLQEYNLFATGTTGGELRAKLGLNVHLFKSGPKGGDQQIGAKIAEGQIDCLIFFCDPLMAQPHDVDIKTLLRLAVYYNIPVACNRRTADFIFSLLTIHQNKNE